MNYPVCGDLILFWCCVSWLFVLGVQAMWVLNNNMIITHYFMVLVLRLGYILFVLCAVLLLFAEVHIICLCDRCRYLTVV